MRRLWLLRHHYTARLLNMRSSVLLLTLALTLTLTLTLTLR